MADLRLPLYTNRNKAFKTVDIGGGKRTRTADLLVANQLLSQLSYAPPFFGEGPDLWWA